MAYYRKKPVIIEAYQVPPDGEDCSPEMTNFLLQSERDIERPGDGTILIHTLEGVMEAKSGDYIIRGIANEFYPCKPEIFAETYEAIEEQI